MAEPTHLYAIIVMGVSACGKSTIGQGIADQLGIPFDDGDKYHPESNIAKMRSGTVRVRVERSFSLYAALIPILTCSLHSTLGIPLNDEDRKDWLENLSKLMSQRCAEGTGAVIACSALKVSYRNVIRGLHGEGDKKEVTFVYLKGSFEVFDERIRARTGHFMPSTLLQSQFDTLQEPTPDEAKSNSYPGYVVTVDASMKPEEVIKQASEEISKIFAREG